MKDSGGKKVHCKFYCNMCSAIMNVFNFFYYSAWICYENLSCTFLKVEQTCIFFVHVTLISTEFIRDDASLIKYEFYYVSCIIYPCTEHILSVLYKIGNKKNVKFNECASISAIKCWKTEIFRIKYWEYMNCFKFVKIH